MALCNVVETWEATFTRMHGVIFQKAEIFTVIAMGISKLKKIVFLIDVDIYAIFLGCKNWIPYQIGVLLCNGQETGEQRQ